MGEDVRCALRAAELWKYRMRSWLGRYSGDDFRVFLELMPPQA